MPIPKNIDPYQMARSRSTLQGDLECHHLTRIDNWCNTVTSDKQSPRVYVDLQWFMDEANLAAVTGKLSYGLTLECQRCLNDFDKHFDVGIDVRVVFSEEQAKHLGKHQEYVVIDEKTLQLHQWIEDEIILATPSVPSHRSDEYCDSLLKYADNKPQYEQVSGENINNSNPFHMLNQLKIDNRDK